jgi:hypothetical protein
MYKRMTGDELYLDNAPPPMTNLEELSLQFKAKDELRNAIGA